MRIKQVLCVFRKSVSNKRLSWDQYLQFLLSKKKLFISQISEIGVRYPKFTPYIEAKFRMCVTMASADFYIRQ